LDNLDLSKHSAIALFLSMYVNNLVQFPDKSRDKSLVFGLEQNLQSTGKKQES